jgi:hypothetical protein
MRSVLLLLCLGGVASAQDIKVEGTLGTLDDAAVQSVVQKHAAALETCFTDVARSLRYVGGPVRLTLRVALDGRVKRVAAISELGNWDVEKCLMTRAKTFQFARPRGGEAEVQLPFEFTARTATSMQALGGVDEVERSMARCGRRPEGTGVVFYVGPGGKITSTGFSSDAPLSESWADCAAASARKARLEDPRGKVVKVVLP